MQFVCVHLIRLIFQPCFLLFSGSSTTFKWRNTPARPSPKESRAPRRFTSPSTRKSTECSTCTTTATTILRYGDLRCAFHSTQHISISLYSVCFIIYDCFQVPIFINRSDLHFIISQKIYNLLVEFWHAQHDCRSYTKPLYMYVLPVAYVSRRF